MQFDRRALAALLLLLVVTLPTTFAVRPKLGRERLVFQTKFGDIHMGFYHEVAPKTSRLICDLGSVGAYTSNHFFRVDKGFVAQTAGVIGGRTVALDAQQTRLASATVPLEVDPEVKHDRRGILSMARGEDPNSGGSSFSILLGPAPHLDMQYAIFGEVTRGIETLAQFEELPTRRDGIFVMPVERIEILASYVYVIPEGQSEEAGFQTITTYARSMEDTYQAAVAMVDRITHTQLPGHQGM